MLGASQKGLRWINVVLHFYPLPYLFSVQFFFLQFLRNAAQLQLVYCGWMVFRVLRFGVGILWKRAVKRRGVFGSTDTDVLVASVPASTFAGRLEKCVIPIV